MQLRMPGSLYVCSLAIDVELAKPVDTFTSLRQVNHDTGRLEVLRAQERHDSDMTKHGSSWYAHKGISSCEGAYHAVGHFGMQRKEGTFTAEPASSSREAGFCSSPASVFTATGMPPGSSSRACASPLASGALEAACPSPLGNAASSAACGMSASCGAPDSGALISSLTCAQHTPWPSAGLALSTVL